MIDEYGRTTEIVPRGRRVARFTRLLARWRIGAQPTFESRPNVFGAAGLSQNPGAKLKGRLMTHVSRVTTFQLRNPVALGILMKARNASNHLEAA